MRCVRKEFGRIGERITAINDVTIDFYNQEFSVILGHNGAGKSCLLKIIIGIYEINHMTDFGLRECYYVKTCYMYFLYVIGMYKPTHGHVYLENESSIYSIGYCPQENILVNYLTTIQHLYIFGMVNIFCY